MSDILEYEKKLKELAGTLTDTYAMVDPSTGTGKVYDPAAWAADSEDDLFPDSMLEWMDYPQWDREKRSEEKPGTPKNMKYTEKFAGLVYVVQNIVPQTRKGNIRVRMSSHFDVHAKDQSVWVMKLHEGLAAYEKGELPENTITLAAEYDAYLAKAATETDPALTVSGTEKYQMQDDVRSGRVIDFGAAEKDELIQRIVQARTQILPTHTFIGAVSANLAWRESEDPRIKTCATNGETVWINMKHFSTLSINEMSFALYHNVYHILLEHVGDTWRGEGFEPKRWAAAQDFLVNMYLTDEKVGEAPEGVYLDRERYHGKFAEEIYHDLVERFPIDDKDPGAIPVDGEGNSLDDLGSTLDDHGLFDKLSPTRKKEISNRVGEIVRNAAYTSGGAGLHPAVKKMVDEFIDPQLDWRTLINNRVEALRRLELTYAKPGKKTNTLQRPLTEDDLDIDIVDLVLDQDVRFVHPSRTHGDRAEITVAIDVSGSITVEMITEMLSEVAGITTTLDEWRMNILHFDTQVYDHKVFSSEDGDDEEAVKEYAKQLKGDGGTDFMVVWDHMVKKKHVPHQLIFFTDGLPCGEWGIPDYCPTLWVLHGNYPVDPPFGEWARYEDKKK